MATNENKMSHPPQAGKGELCFTINYHLPTLNFFRTPPAACSVSCFTDVGCIVWLGATPLASPRAHVSQMHRTPRSSIGTASSISAVSLMLTHQQATTGCLSA